MKDWKPIAIEDTLITISTFISQGWEKHEENEDGDSYTYWSLPLPKDNPDGDTICLISSGDDECDDEGIPEGTFIVSLYDYNGLGFCTTEEQIEILYKALTGEDIYDDDVSVD